MPKFVIDEDLPRSTATVLRNHGYEVRDVRDCSLRGASDEEVYKFALNEGAVLVSADIGFGNVLSFPVGNHFDIVVVRFPNEMTAKEVNRQLIGKLKDLIESDFKGNLIVIEPGKVRIRREQ